MARSLRLGLQIVVCLLLLNGCSGSTVNTQPHNSNNNPNNPAPQLPSHFEWTDIQPSADSRLLYVSPTDPNNMTNDCLSETTPCALNRAVSMMRDGYPDWLLLKRGDVFSGPLASGWSLSGRSETEPMVIATYGTAAARPQFRTGSGPGFANTINEAVRHVFVVGISFVAHTRNPASPDYVNPDGADGITLLAWGHAVEDILIEGCEVGYYRVNVVAHNDGSAPINNIRFRGNYIHDSWTNYHPGFPDHQGFSQGIYSNYIDGLLLEQNILDHNGGLFNYPGDTRFSVPSGLTETAVTVTWFNHQIYSDSDNRNVVALHNIFANGDGVQVRSGGIVHGNIFSRTITSLSGGSDDNLATIGGFSFDIRDNFFLEGTDFPPLSDTPGARGTGIFLKNTDSTVGATIANNVFLRDMSAEPYGHVIRLQGTVCNPGPAQIACPIRRANVFDNFAHNWRGGLQLSGIPGTELDNITIHDNTIQTPDDTQSPVALVDNADAGYSFWSDNRYFSGRADGKWFSVENVSINGVGWRDAVNEMDFTATMQTMANTDIKFETVVMGASATSYDAAFTHLGAQQTPWNWEASLETPHLIDALKSAMGL